MENAGTVPAFPPLRIGIGCWAFGGGAYWGEQNQRDVDQVVHAALDAGVSFFDTARMYNDGASERSLGLALKGRREQAVICSKLSPDKAYPEAMRRECELSLQALGTDYLDLYMLHWPINQPGLRHFTDDPAVLEHPPAVEDAFYTLDQLRREGKIRAVGVSNFGVEQMAQALRYCPGIAANELPYNILSRAIEAEIAPFCREHRIAVISSMTLQQGILADLYRSAEEVPPHQAHSRHFAAERGGGLSRHGGAGAEAEVFATVALLRRLAEELGVTVAQLSIAWVLSNPWISCALIGSRNQEELRENLEAAALVLDAAVVARIDEASLEVLKKLGNNPDYYENPSASRVC